MDEAYFNFSIFSIVHRHEEIFSAIKYIFPFDIQIMIFSNSAINRTYDVNDYDTLVDIINNLQDGETFEEFVPHKPFLGKSNLFKLENNEITIRYYEKDYIVDKRMYIDIVNEIKKL